MTVDDIPAAAILQERSLLKAHKLLPRRTQEQSQSWDVQSPALYLERKGSDSSQSSSGPSLGAGSPLPDPILPTRGVIALPPTPPKYAFDKSDSNALPPLRVRRKRGLKSCQSPGSSTPRNQRSPPTPDTTPPREPLKPSLLDRPNSKRVPSSRTESFQTAREHQPSSDDETTKLLAQSAKSTRNSPLNGPRLTRTREVGLGLGLESDEDGAAIRERNVKDTFPNFDGRWDQEGSPGMDWNDELMRNVTIRKRRTGKSRRYKQPVKPKDGTYAANAHDEFSAQLMRELSLEERINRKREAGQTEDLDRFAEEILWPTQHADLQFDSILPNMQDKRFSGVSMVVEAMVVDTVPQRRRTLRHTSKNLHLRSASNLQEAQRSVSNPEGQSRAQGRRNSGSLHKSRRLSSSSASIGSDGKPPLEIIPVVIVPQRRSSLSAPTSKPGSRTSSITSASVQARTMPDTDATVNKQLPRRRRTISDASPSTSNSDKKRGRGFSPVIPKRASSLSAPTSRNVSRTTSLTSASVKSPGNPLDVVPADDRTQRRRNSDNVQVQTSGSARDLFPSDFLSQRRRSSEHASSQSSENRLRDIVPIDYLRSHRRRSSDHTHSQSPDETRERSVKKVVSPGYSQFSGMSATAGTPEVGEATAVSIFPHNNDSILVVQQNARNVLGEPAVAITAAPVTPPTKHQQEIETVDSPLRHPRKPPQPPAFKIIPPTPAALTPAEEADRQLGGPLRPSMGGKLNSSGPMSLVRRALSTRRYSDSFVSTFTPRPKPVDDATQTDAAASPPFRRPSYIRRDSKLHPFWKPRGFWDDLDDDKMVDDEFLRHPPPKRPALVPTRTGTGRLTSYTVARVPIATGPRSTSPRLSTDSLRIRKNQRARRTHKVPGLGLHIEYVGLRGIQERIRNLREQRDIAATEKRRNRLRKQIGTPKVIKKSVDV